MHVREINVQSYIFIVHIIVLQYYVILTTAWLVSFEATKNFTVWLYWCSIVVCMPLSTTPFKMLVKLFGTIGRVTGIL